MLRGIPGMVQDTLIQGLVGKTVLCLQLCVYDDRDIRNSGLSRPVQRGVGTGGASQHGSSVHVTGRMQHHLPRNQLAAWLAAYNAHSHVSL